MIYRAHGLVFLGAIKETYSDFFELLGTFEGRVVDNIRVEFGRNLSEMGKLRGFGINEISYGF